MKVVSAAGRVSEAENSSDMQHNRPVMVAMPQWKCKNAIDRVTPIQCAFFPESELCFFCYWQVF
jgi:hypothetical protein